MNTTNILKGIAAGLAITAGAVTYARSRNNESNFFTMFGFRAALAGATASNALYKPAKRPVGLFFGGTSGIGQAMAEQLARQTNGRAQIILLGRNQAAAEQIIASFPKTDPSTPPEDASDYSFIKVDATSMAEVRQVTSKLLSQLPKANFIVATAGYLTLKGREETGEGIDKKLACNFYSRFRFIHDLAPLLEKAAEDGEQAGVISVLSAGKGGPIELDDLGLAKTYSLRNAHHHAVAYNDAAMAAFSEKYPGVSFYHAYPGGVNTNILNGIPLARNIAPLLSFMVKSPAECAELMWWRVWSPDAPWKTGAHQIDDLGAEITHGPYITPESTKLIWNHAIEVTEERN